MEHSTGMSVHPPDRQERAFPATPASPRAAREFVAAVLAAGGASAETISDFRLVVSELVANAVQHARTTVVVEVLLDDPARIGVRVTGGTLPDRFRHPAQWRIGRPEAASGRGLGIVRDRVAEVRVARNEEGDDVVSCWAQRA